jgi:uncharacterized protein (TIGR03663 family)
LTIKITNRIKLTTPSPKIRWAIFCALALLAFAVRLPRLGERPMHTDESINAYITGELLAGEIFHYDPQDRHGPALFLAAIPVARICGVKNFSQLTETQLRLSTALTGTATVLLFGAGVEMFGFTACLVAALLFAFAPLPVYYSRYFIHETLFVTATLGLILSGWRALQKNSLSSAALAGFCAALMLACKETAVLHFLALGLAAAISWRFHAAGKIPPAQTWLTAALTFLIAGILLFTWGGQNWSALADLFRAIPHFAARAGGEGHEKPFDYYFHLLDPMLVLFIIATAGVYAAICDAVGGVRKPGLWLVIYGLVVFLIYSAIPYKTPWLALNLWLPFALICGSGVAAFWEQVKNPAGRWGVGIAGAFLLAALATQTRTFVFDKPADEKNPYAYAHTGEDLLRLPARLDELARKNKISNPRIAVVAADPWPLPWYLRKFSQAGFWQPGQETGPADFFITTTDVSGGLADRLKHFRPEFFGARPNVLLVLWSPLAMAPGHE